MDVYHLITHDKMFKKGVTLNPTVNIILKIVFSEKKDLLLEDFFR